MRRRDGRAQVSGAYECGLGCLADGARMSGARALAWAPLVSEVGWGWSRILVVENEEIL